MDNVNIRVNALQPTVSTSAHRQIQIHNDITARSNNKNFPLLGIGEFSLRNINIGVNSAPSVTKRSNKQFSDTGVVYRLPNVLRSFSKNYNDDLKLVGPTI